LQLCDSVTLNTEPETQNQKQPIAGHWLVLAAAVLWGTTGTSQALAPPGAQSTVIGTMRLVVGGSTLLAWAWLRGDLSTVRHLPRRATLLAALGVAAYQLTFFGGVARAGVAVGTIVAVGSAPVMAGILGYLVHGERSGRLWFVSTVLAIVGNYLLVAGGKMSDIDPWGIVLALGAGLSYAGYTAASKSLLIKNQPPDAVMAVVFSLGAVLLLPTLIGANLRWIIQPRGMVVVLHLGVIATGVSYMLFARGLRVTPVATTVTLSLAEPFTAALLGIFVLGERLTAQSMAGVLLIFVGLVILSFGQSKNA